MKKLFLISMLLFSLCDVSQAKFITHVTLTTYNPTVKQCGKNPLVTANGTKINVHHLRQKKIKYCAVSRDLLWCFPYGSEIHIEGHGVYTVVDTMHERFNHTVDVLQHHTEKNFKKKNIKVVKLK